MRKGIMIATLLFFAPAVAAAGQIGGFAQNLGGQMLTVTADVGYKSKSMEYHSNEEDMTSRSFAVKATYGMSDRLDLSVSLGFADIQDLGSFDSSLGTLYGAGLKYLLFKGPNSNTEVAIAGNIETFEVSDNGIDARSTDYHVAAVVSNKAGNVTPFGGLRYSDSVVDFEGPVEYKAEKNFGLFGGADYFVNPNVYFTGEVHIFDENTVYLGVGYNF